MRRAAAALAIAGAVAAGVAAPAFAADPTPFVPRPGGNLPQPTSTAQATPAPTPAATGQAAPTPQPTTTIRPGSGATVPYVPPQPTPLHTPTAAPTTRVGQAPGPIQPTSIPTLAPTQAPYPQDPAPGATVAPHPSAPGGSDNPTGASGSRIAELCRAAPDPEMPGKSALDVIDFGAAAGDGLYARYRYAGWGSHLYNPGCADAAVKALADQVGGQIGMVGNALTEEGGANRTTNIVLGGARLGIAVAVSATRVGFGEYPVWDVASQLADSARVTFGKAVLAGFLGICIAASMVWLASQRRLDMAGFTGALWRIAGITALGLLLIAWNGTVGGAYDEAARTTHAAANEVVTSQPAAEGVGAGDVLGDALMTNVYLPMWGAVHLGWDTEAIGTYAERLHAASAFTTEEAARVAGSEAETNALSDQKKRDYDTVAAEIKASHPAAYTQLEGKKAADRVLFAVLLALAVLPVLMIVGFAALVVVAARIIVRVAAGVYPVIVAVLQFPALHKWGIGIPYFTLKWAAYGVVSSAVSVVLFRVLIVAALAEGAGSVFQRIAALTFVCIAIIVGWVFRGQLAAKVGARPELDAATQAIHDLVRRIDSATAPHRKELAERSRKFRHGKPAEKATPESQADPGKPVPAQTPPRRRPTKAAARAVATDRVVRAATSVAPPPVRRTARAAVVIAGRGRRR